MTREDYLAMMNPSWIGTEKDDTRSSHWQRGQNYQQCSRLVILFLSSACMACFFVFVLIALFRRRGENGQSGARTGRSQLKRDQRMMKNIELGVAKESSQQGIRISGREGAGSGNFSDLEMSEKRRINLSSLPSSRYYHDDFVDGEHMLMTHTDFFVVPAHRDSLEEDDQAEDYPVWTP